MADGLVAPIPEGYQLSANAASVLAAEKGIDQGQQITLLRNFVVDMGLIPPRVTSPRSRSPARCKRPGLGPVWA